jgi:hypothetical protein
LKEEEEQQDVFFLLSYLALLLTYFVGVRLHPPGRTDKKLSADVSVPGSPGFP